MNERLIQFLAAENMTQAQFADSINVARAGVSHIVQGRNKPGWDFIINTMNRYPTLNIEWLLTGKGKMYKTAVNEVRRVETDTLFGDDLSDGNDGRPAGGNDGADYGGIFDSQPVELAEPAPASGNAPLGAQQSASDNAPLGAQQSASRNAPLGAQQSAYGNAPLGARQSAYDAPRQTERQGASQNAPQPGFQTVVNKPNVAKVIVFFEDGTFQECK